MQIYVFLKRFKGKGSKDESPSESDQSWVGRFLCCPTFWNQPPTWWIPSDRRASVSVPIFIKKKKKHTHLVLVPVLPGRLGTLGTNVCHVYQRLTPEVRPWAPTLTDLHTVRAKEWLHYSRPVDISWENKLSLITDQAQVPPCTVLRVRPTEVHGWWCFTELLCFDMYHMSGPGGTPLRECFCVRRKHLTGWILDQLLTTMFWMMWGMICHWEVQVLTTEWIINSGWSCSDISHWFLKSHMWSSNW